MSAYAVPISAFIAPRLEQQSVPGECNLSALQGGFFSANQMTIDIGVVRSAAEKTLFSPRMGASTVAIVEIVGPGVSWIYQTEAFDMEVGIEVQLNPQASLLNGVSLSGPAFLGFTADLFTFAAEATMAGSPTLPTSDGALPVTVTYMLVEAGVPREVHEFAATINVSVIAPLLGGPTLQYTMGPTSITLGNLTLPNFSFPLGTKRAEGTIKLLGGGYSIFWSVQLLVDPYRNFIGYSKYPTNAQGTTGFGVNFSGAVSDCPDFDCQSTLVSSFQGAATFDPGLLQVPNYVPSVAGSIELAFFGD